MNDEPGLDLKRCDVFFSRGHGFVSDAIRFFSRNFGESRAKVSHVGIVVEDGDIGSVWIMEARSGVARRKFWDSYGPPQSDWVAIYRAKNLTDADVDVIVAAAERYNGYEYGYGKLIAHLLDWLLLGAYVFRRLAKMDKYPICSWLVAHSFAKAGKDFGVEPGAAGPDDIWDFVTRRKDIYELVRALAPFE
ncbi:MAG TPA: hypothetical protein VMO47_06560 [Rhodothermales bacterium]|nr:hypothetical protein [Rhodothermales bacterium]